MLESLLNHLKIIRSKSLSFLDMFLIRQVVFCCLVCYPTLKMNSVHTMQLKLDRGLCNDSDLQVIGVTYFTGSQ